MGDFEGDWEKEDLSRFKYLVMDAAVELSEMYFICTYCGAKAPVKNSIVHLPTCAAPIVFNSLSKKPIDTAIKP